MRIIIVGATGTLGRPITKAFSKEHEVIQVGSKSGDIRVDIGDPKSIDRLFRETGPFDALISVAGSGHNAPLSTLTDTDFRKGIDSKLMGQINLVLIGQHSIRPGGSFTLTSGVLSAEPMRMGVNLSTINRALEGFVMAAAVELQQGVRINAVSPNVVEDSPQYFPFFPGVTPVSMDRVINAYMRSVLGPLTGQTITAW